MLLEVLLCGTIAVKLSCHLCLICVLLCSGGKSGVSGNMIGVPCVKDLLLV
jgi:hypothetical protein